MENKKQNPLVEQMLKLAEVADVLTKKQAKEFVDFLVSLTNEQKKQMVSEFNKFADTVSQETHRKINEALSIIAEKANDNQLEVRQLTNKQKVAHEAKMSELEALIEEFRNFEIPEPEEIDREGIIQEALSRVPAVEIEEYELLGENVVDSINSLEVTPDKQIDAKHIKNLPKQNTQFVGGGSKNLSQLNDVNLGTLTDGEVLTYDSATNTWRNEAGGAGTSNHALLSNLDYASAGHTGFQPTLVSGTNIKTVNGSSLLGSGDLSVSAGSGITRTITTTSGSATMGSTASVDYVYFVAGAHTMSLPSPNTNRYTVKNNHSANITIDTVGAETIEGAASISIAPGESVDIISDATNWFVV